MVGGGRRRRQVRSAERGRVEAERGTGRHGNSSDADRGRPRSTISGRGRDDRRPRNGARRRWARAEATRARRSGTHGRRALHPGKRGAGVRTPPSPATSVRSGPCHHASSTPTALPLWPRSRRPSTRGKNRRRRRCGKPPGTCCRCWKETPPAVRWKCGWYRSRRCSASPDRGTREGRRPTSLRPIRLPGSSLPPGASAGRRPWNPGRSERVVRELICPSTFR